MLAQLSEIDGQIKESAELMGDPGGIPDNKFLEVNELMQVVAGKLGFMVAVNPSIDIEKQSIELAAVIKKLNDEHEKRMKDKIFELQINRDEEKQTGGG